MSLTQFLKWRLNDLIALRALAPGSDQQQALLRRLYAEATPFCAAEIQSASPGTPLSSRRCIRRIWTVLGYTMIVLFLLTIAGFILSYWLLSEQKLPGLTPKLFLWMAAAAIIEIGGMLLAASCITRIQRNYISQCADAVLHAYDRLPADAARSIAGLLSARPDCTRSPLRCACTSCGTIFEEEEPSEGVSPDFTCPHCSKPYSLVFEVPDVELNPDNLNRLKAFLND